MVASFFLSFPFWDICLKKKKQKQLYCSMKRSMLNWARTVATCVFSFASIHTSMGVRTSTVLCCFVDLDFHIWGKKKKRKKKKMSLSPQHDVLLLDACVCVWPRKNLILPVCLSSFLLVCLSVCLLVCFCTTMLICLSAIVSLWNSSVKN